MYLKSRKTYQKVILSALLLGTLVSLSIQKSLYGGTDRYYGKKVTRIDFKDNRSLSNEQLYNMIQTRPGMIFTRSILNQDMKVILSQEAVKDLRVEAKLYKGGVAITYVITEKPEVARIIFKGLKHLNASELEDLLFLKRNNVFSQEKLDRSIERIQWQCREKGLFNCSIEPVVKVDPKNENRRLVTFIVDEGEDMHVAKINIIGVKSIDVNQLYGVMELKEKSFLNNGEFKLSQFESDKEKILDYYRSQGFIDVEMVDAKWEIHWASPNKPGKRVVVINYKIEEGEQYFFNGYEVVWDEDYLSQEDGVPVIKEKEIYKNFELAEWDLGLPFNFRKFSMDRGAINFLYSEKGYIFARVIPEETTINLTEEEIDKLEKSDRQQEGLKDGIDYYNIANLRKIYKKFPERRGKKFTHTKFIIQEGDKGYIENILVKGNDKTQDRVIQREFLVKPGDLYNFKLVQRSREKIYNLGYFSKVDLAFRPGSEEGKMNLLVSVEEQLTGQMSLGGGYGSLTGFSLFSEVSEKNLNGTGQQVKGRLEFGLKTASIDLSWTEPWIFNKPWALTLRGFYYHVERLSGSIATTAATGGETSYYWDKVGAGIGIGHRLGINWYHSHFITPFFSVISNPSSLVDDSVFRLYRQGWQFQNRFTNEISFDNRDNVFTSTEGFSSKAGVEFVGGVLGGTDHFNRYSLELQGYWWPFDFTLFNLIRKGSLRRWRVVFEHRLSGTFTQQTKPVYNDQPIYDNAYIEDFDKLYLGGYEGVRGWDPFDLLFPDLWRGGATHRMIFSNELRIPIEPSMIWGAVFFDMGALFFSRDHFYTDQTTSQEFFDQIDQNLLTSKNIFNLSYYRFSWGFGLRLQIPMMPIRFYWGQRLLWNSTKNWFEIHPQKREFSFVFGIGDYRF